MPEHEPLSPLVDPQILAAEPQPNPLHHDVQAHLGKVAFEQKIDLLDPDSFVDSDEPYALPDAPIDTLTDDLYSFSLGIDELEAPEERAVYSTGVINFINDSSIREVLSEGGYDAGQLGRLVRELSYLEELTPVTLGNLLSFAKAETLQELYQAGDEHLIAMFERGIANNIPSAEAGSFFQNLALAMEKALSPTHGRMITWLRDGHTAKEGLPRFAKDMALHAEFARACATSEVSRIEEESTGNELQNRLKLRRVEGEILKHIVGVSADMSRDFRLGMRARTVPLTDSKVVSHKFGGIDTAGWVKLLGDYGHTVDGIGLYTAQWLYDNAGIVNFDRYTDSQMERNYEILSGHIPELLERLAAADVTVMMADALGDHNGALNNTPAQFEDDNTIFFEIRRPSDFYRHFALLRKLGIQPSTLVLTTHGSIGLQGYGAGDEAFYLTSDERRYKNAHNVRRSSLGRLLREYMRPHSETGERIVILDACRQALGGKLSMAETVARQTEVEDRVVVKAADESINVRKTERGPVFISAGRKHNGKTAQTIEHRRVNKLFRKVSRTRPERGTPLR
ncbi:MAG TPA: hypothetical protein VLH86_01395 [Patescibacteria group bacterium]|nr:hypothetical protein [Patescibacteria group bacterium]